jgi:hypothetical protein
VCGGRFTFIYNAENERCTDLVEGRAGDINEAPIKHLFAEGEKKKAKQRTTMSAKREKKEEKDEEQRRHFAKDVFISR